MAKRTNRAAWGLVVVLAVAVLVGSGQLLVSYQEHLSDQERWVTLLPQEQWGFGRDGVASLRAIAAGLKIYREGNAGGTWPPRYRLGFLSFRVE